MTRIGFETDLHQGPGIFMSRLRTVLEAAGVFDADTPDVWIQLSFHDLPAHIAERRAKGLTKVVVRMDGAYCGRAYRIHKPWVVPAPWLDEAYSAKKNAAKNRRLRENLLAADDIIFQSHFSRQLTQRFVTPTPPGNTIYNGIDLSAFSPDGPDSDRLPSDGTRILMSHSFRPYHRLHDALTILAELRRNPGDLPQPIRLCVLGGDNDTGVFEAAHRQAATLGLTVGADVVFLGKIPAPELAPVYRSADVMLNLSYWDSCPNVVIEAMACGLPLVGVGYGGVGELLGDGPDAGGVCVREDIPFTYLDHTDPARMVAAPVGRYGDALREVVRAASDWRGRSRARAEARFDIRQTAAAYMAVCEGVAAGYAPGLVSDPLFTDHRTIAPPT
ncbi:MAG: glycosyltransferase family 4 protein [Candidatus Melainabacteria bacterium]